MTFHDRHPEENGSAIQPITQPFFDWRALHDVRDTATARIRAAALMAEFLPLGHSPAVETARRRTLEVGAKLEQQILASKPLALPPSARSIAVSLDGGHVKSVRSYQMRSFEVMLACVSNDQGEQQLFSSVPVEADRQRQQLSAVLRDLGATPATPVTVLSDGAEGPRFLGETASQGPTRHVLGLVSPFDASSARYTNSPKLAARDHGRPSTRR